MTYTFKLARRLAVSRAFSMLPVLLLFGGCAGGDATSPDNSPIDVPGSGIYAWRPRESTPVALLVSPSSVTVETNQLLQFRARGRNRAGDTVAASVTWSTTGGTILPDGRFSAASVGTYQVTGSTRTRDSQDMVETSSITVVRRQAKLKAVDVTPSSATLTPGVSQAFAATGQLASGDTVPIGVTWSARGGSIDAGGLYVAGDTVGTFQVIAIKNAGTLADTATITINAPPSPPPPSDSVITPPTIPIEPVPPPPDTAATPAPVLDQVLLLPASVTLAPNTTKQFSATATWSDSTTTPVTPVWSATGGTITTGGLYTAGSTAGTFRLIATSGVLADTSTITITAPLGSATYGVPFGPWAAWKGTTILKANTEVFTASIGGVSSDSILARIDAARTKRVKLFLALTGGSHDNYLSTINGVYQFDMAKWKAKMNTFNTTAIKTAVAAAIADGTIIGNSVMDEPNAAGSGDGNTWGPAGTMTKARVDSLCGYVKSIFPTLPTGVVHRYDVFEPTKAYRTCDFIVSQYATRLGSVTAYRDGALAMAQRDGIAIAFSMNIINGGIQDRDGTWDCTGTGGLGTYSPNCRMTAQELKDYGLVLGPAGCAFTLWQYDSDFMARSDNQLSFKDLAGRLATAPAKACRRQ
jgi:hypothetical protein